jgi:hypothetical protein
MAFAGTDILVFQGTDTCTAAEMCLSYTNCTYVDEVVEPLKVLHAWDCLKQGNDRPLGFVSHCTKHAYIYLF